MIQNVVVFFCLKWKCNYNHHLIANYIFEDFKEVEESIKKFTPKIFKVERGKQKAAIIMGFVSDGTRPGSIIQTNMNSELQAYNDRKQRLKIVICSLPARTITTY